MTIAKGHLPAAHSPCSPLCSWSASCTCRQPRSAFPYTDTSAPCPAPGISGKKIEVSFAIPLVSHIAAPTPDCTALDARYRMSSATSPAVRHISALHVAHSSGDDFSTYSLSSFLQRLNNTRAKARICRKYNKLYMSKNVSPLPRSPTPFSSSSSSLTFDSAAK